LVLLSDDDDDDEDDDEELEAAAADVGRMGSGSGGTESHDRVRPTKLSPPSISPTLTGDREPATENRI
jgi:hypothetical protein